MNDIFMLLGDSLTFGYGVKRQKSFSNLLANAINIDVINKGINGDTTASMMNRLYEDILCHKPKYIFIMGGTNDLLCKRSLKYITENLEEIITECLEITTNIYIGIPPCIIPSVANILFSPSDFYEYASHSLPILRNNIISLCNKYSLRYIDLYSLTYNFIEDYKSIYLDGIHLNEYGNRLIFNELKKIIPSNILLSKL